MDFSNHIRNEIARGEMINLAGGKYQLQNSVAERYDAGLTKTELANEGLLTRDSAFSFYEMITEVFRAEPGLNNFLMMKGVNQSVDASKLIHIEYVHSDTEGVTVGVTGNEQVNTDKVKKKSISTFMPVIFTKTTVSTRGTSGSDDEIALKEAAKRVIYKVNEILRVGSGLKVKGKNPEHTGDITGNIQGIFNHPNKFTESALTSTARWGQSAADPFANVLAAVKQLAVENIPGPYALALPTDLFYELGRLIGNDKNRSILAAINETIKSYGDGVTGSTLSDIFIENRTEGEGDDGAKTIKVFTVNSMYCKRLVGSEISMYQSPSTSFTGSTDVYVYAIVAPLLKPDYNDTVGLVTQKVK